MANFKIRTVDEIFQELLTEKTTLTALNGLVTTVTDENSLITELDAGKVPDWVLWLYNMAVSTNLTDIATFSGVTEIEDTINNQIVPTSNWYIKKALEFQNGDSLIIDPITYQVTYATINPANLIIASCTTLEFANRLILKVRRLSTDIFNVGEQTAFEGYMNKIKAAGTQIEVHNYAADELTLNMTIIYEGNKRASTTKSLVEAAINNYIVNLAFDSKFYTTQLVDVLQLVDGVIDPRFDSASALDSLAVTTAFTHEYTSNAGYMAINVATPLSTTITYIPK